MKPLFFLAEIPTTIKKKKIGERRGQDKRKKTKELENTGLWKSMIVC